MTDEGQSDAIRCLSVWFCSKQPWKCDSTLYTLYTQPCNLKRMFAIALIKANEGDCNLTGMKTSLQTSRLSMLIKKDKRTYIYLSIYVADFNKRGDNSRDVVFLTGVSCFTWRLPHTSSNQLAPISSSHS